jgi:DHA1 family tetracycline resistance protein-like MFS transporter
MPWPPTRAADPGLLGVARLGQGIGAAAFSPAAGALLATAGKQGGHGGSFGSYGMVKGVGYLFGALLGGALVVAGGYSLLFGLLALVAVAVGVLIAVRIPAVPTVSKPRETLIGLALRLTRPSFLGPVATLGAATAALSAGVGFPPVAGARDHLGPIATGAAVSILAAVAVVQARVGKASDAGGPLVVGALAVAGLAVGLGGLGLLCAGMGGLVLVAHSRLRPRINGHYTPGPTSKDPR